MIRFMDTLATDSLIPPNFIRNVSFLNENNILSEVLLCLKLRCLILWLQKDLKHLPDPSKFTSFH